MRDERWRSPEPTKSALGGTSQPRALGQVLADAAVFPMSALGRKQTQASVRNGWKAAIASQADSHPGRALSGFWRALGRALFR
jgi:hypothetical protein